MSDGEEEEDDTKVEVLGGVSGVVGCLQENFHHQRKGRLPLKVLQLVEFGNWIKKTTKKGLEM